MEENNRSAAPQILAALGKALCYLALFLLCQALVSLVYSTAISLYALLRGGPADPALLMEEVYRYTSQITLISNGCTLLILAVFFLIRRKNPLAEAGLTGTRPRLAAAGVVIAPALYVLVTVVLALLPQAWLESYAQSSSWLGGTGVPDFLATVIAAPLAEEIVFRGLVQSRLGRVMPGRLAVVLSALLFGLCHGQAVWMAYAFVLGLFFGWMTLRARSILPSLLAHAVFNAIGHFSVVLDGRMDVWTMLMGLLLFSAVGCLLDRRGVKELFSRGPGQPEAP